MLLPVRPGIGADDAAAGADHARAERWHRRVVRKRAHIDDRIVMAAKSAAPDPERAHVCSTHVAEGHHGVSIKH